LKLNLQANKNNIMLRIIGRRHASQILNKLPGIRAAYPSRNDFLFSNESPHSSQQQQELFDLHHYQSRSFSSQQPRADKNGRKGKNNPLVNEKLISFLMNKSKSSARDIQVRLVVTEEGANGESKNSADVVSLLEAVKKSNELGLDLVGVSINQKIPTLKAQDFDKLVYQKKGKVNKQKPKNLKEYKFRAGIADHDFQRKVSNIVKYLKKGHSCRIMLTANGFHRRQDPAGVETGLKKLQDSEVGEFSKVAKTEINKEKSYATVSLTPLAE